MALTIAGVTLSSAASVALAVGDAPARVSSTRLADGDGLLGTPVTDGVHLYLPSIVTPATVVKFRLSDQSRVANFTFDAEEDGAVRGAVSTRVRSSVRLARLRASWSRSRRVT